MNSNETKQCSYCRQVRPISEMMQGKIVFQNGKYDYMGKYKRFVDEAVNWYCKDKPCHGYDQMAHEG